MFEVAARSAQDMQEEKTFKQLLKETLKSEDTEEWLDVHFTRPVGLWFALIWKRLGVHPNTITILSMFLGIGAAFMFYHTGFWYNVGGMLLLMFANFCDSTDGQLARMTGQKTLVGRVLDGFAGDVWFFSIYAALCLRLMPQPLSTSYYFDSPTWGIWIWVLAFLAGILSHSPQATLADYYRQIHLFFQKGKSDSEFDNSEQQRAIYESLPEKGAFWPRAFHYNYANYCRRQERVTPRFQKFFAKLQERYPDMDQMPEDLRQRFLAGSRPLMPHANVLSFNTRAICLYASCLLNCPWAYFLLEITVFNLIYVYMHKHHEQLCMRMMNELEQPSDNTDSSDASDKFNRFAPSDNSDQSESFDTSDNSQE